MSTDQPSPTRAVTPRMVVAVLAAAVAILVGGLVVLAVGNGDDDGASAPGGQLAAFCELFQRFEATKASLGFDDAVLDTPVSELEENLARQGSLQAEILGVAPGEIHDDVEVVVDFDREFVPLLLVAVRDAGSLRAFVEAVETAGHSPAGLGAYFGFPAEQVAAYEAAVARTQRYVDSACVER